MTLNYYSGVGGTGKSFFIATIRQQVSEIWKDNTVVDSKCGVGAPTGLASYIWRCNSSSHVL